MSVNLLLFLSYFNVEGSIMVIHQVNIFQSHIFIKEGVAELVFFCYEGLTVMGCSFNIVST